MPESPVRKRPNAAGNGTTATCAVPFSVNTRDVQPFPGIGFESIQLRFVNAFVEGLNTPVASPPILTDTPDPSPGPAKPADSEVRSDVIVEPFVLPVGTGLGPLVNNWNV